MITVLQGQVERSGGRGGRGRPNREFTNGVIEWMQLDGGNSNEKG